MRMTLTEKVTSRMSIVRDIALLTLTALMGLSPQHTEAATTHEYFEYLASLPEVVLARAYRDQATIDKDRNVDGRNYVKEEILYDPDLDAMRFLFRKDDANPASALRPNFDEVGRVSSGTLFYTWESLWDPRWALPENREGMETHKTFQLGILTSSSDQRRIEIRTRYSDDTSEIGRIDFRRYVWSAPGNSVPLPNQQNEFVISPNTWTRYWAFVDFDNQEVTVWVADTKRDPVMLLDRFKFSDMSAGDLTAGLDSFWFQYNSSQSRSGPELYTWARNLVVLRDISNPSFLVQQGADVGGGSVVVTPEPPSWDQ